MRTRNQRASIASARIRRALGVLALTAAIVPFAGCGGGGSSAPPTVSNLAIVTRPAPLTYTGGTATISASITDPNGVDPSSVKVDVTDQTGASIIGGPQLMQAPLPPSTTYTYQVTLPNNLNGSSNKVYTATVTATNLKGVKPLAPITVGTILVPFPPPPPASP